MLTVLLTRPREQSEDFAADLAAACPGRFRPVVSPLQEIAFRREPIDLGAAAALVFTSANGVAAFAHGAADRSRLAYCVGAETAAAARAAGLAVRSADGDAAALLALLARDRPASVLHLRGERVAVDLTGPLRHIGVAARSAVVYGQRTVGATPEAEALGREGRIDRIAVFSALSAQRLVEAAASWRLDQAVAVAISRKAAAPLAALRLGGRRIAPHPSRRGMIEALAAT
jgi:uroporphyrinogen-III synthase